MLWHAGAGAIVLVVTFVMFSFGWIGGGDAKLAAATALWLGFAHLFDYLVYASVLGGALTLALIQFRTLPLPQLLAGRDWIERLHRQWRRHSLRHRARGRGADRLSAHRMDGGARHLRQLAAAAPARM